MYLVVGTLAALENVFPPVPADTAVALGAFLTRGGGVTVAGVYLVTLGANVLSAGLMYATARTWGRGFFQGTVGRRLLRPEALVRIERLYQRYGTWGIFASRFVPGVRAVVPPFAGIAGLSPWRALVPTVTASAIWYGALVLLASQFIQHWEDVERLTTGANRWAAGLVGALLLALGLWWWRRRR